MARSPPRIPSRSVHICSSRISHKRRSARSTPEARSVITGSPGLKEVPGQGTSAIDLTRKQVGRFILLGNDFRSNQPPRPVKGPFRDHARSAGYLGKAGFSLVVRRWRHRLVDARKQRSAQG